MRRTYRIIGGVSNCIRVNWRFDSLFLRFAFSEMKFHPLFSPLPVYSMTGLCPLWHASLLQVAGCVFDRASCKLQVRRLEVAGATLEGRVATVRVWGDSWECDLQLFNQQYSKNAKGCKHDRWFRSIRFWSKWLAVVVGFNCPWLQPNVARAYLILYPRLVSRTQIATLEVLLL